MSARKWSLVVNSHLKVAVRHPFLAVGELKEAIVERRQRAVKHGWIEFKMLYIYGLQSLVLDKKFGYNGWSVCVGNTGCRLGLGSILEYKTEPSYDKECDLN
jgi:hypothetical protein